MIHPVKKTESQATQSWRWLALPAALHLVSTLVVFILGRFRFLPDQFNAIGVGTSFASDGVRYHSEAIGLVQTLSNDGVVAWFHAPPQFHVKVYSLAYAVFGPVFGFNILAVEPLNALYYVAAVWAAFAIGRQVFNRRAGFLSAGIIALWPSFLLHSTQLLRDTLLIALWLLLMLGLAKLLTVELQWRSGVASALIAAVAILGIWIVRIDLWIVVRASVGLVTAFVILRQLRTRKILLANSLCVAGLLAVVMVIPQVFGRTTPAVPDLVAQRRQISIATEQKGATSSVDKNVSLESNADIVRYLPRAIALGFFAPFPNSWFQKGVVPTRRLFAGVETLAMYLIELAACLTLWRWRRRLEVWLLWLIAAMGMLGLGLVVVNIGTLYRLRYPFLMMLIIVASASLMELGTIKNQTRRGHVDGHPAG